jgi:hypothetical protein
VKWRESHQGSYVPRAKDHYRRKNVGPRRAEPGVVAAGGAATAVER